MKTTRARVVGASALLTSLILVGVAALASAQGASPSPAAAQSSCPAGSGWQGMHGSWSSDCGPMMGDRYDGHQGMMGDWYDGHRGMMGDWGGMMGGPVDGPGPGQAGFVAGTVDAPRVVRVIAGPGFAFTPTVVPIVTGETITFEVTVMGPTTHEFKVGPLEAVVADAPDLPEIAGLQMMQTGSLTYTFDGPGPYGFACHEPGHFEAGMFGVITLVA
jgi:plastocyanin